MQRPRRSVALALFLAAPAWAPQGAPAARASGPAEISDASRAAADEIGQYVNAHMAELRPQMAAMGVLRPTTGADLDKLKTLLPADLAGKFDLAKPALLELAGKGRAAMIEFNLKAVGDMMVGLGPDGHQHEVKPISNLGELLTSADFIHYFVAPETIVPDNILKGAHDQQVAWVNANTIFKLLAPGKPTGNVSPDAIIAVERPDLDHSQSTLAVLMGDGVVKMMDRAEVEKALQKK